MPSPSSSAPFRSHLMQQFAAAARNPARTPPLALMGWMDAAGDHRARSPDGGPLIVRNSRAVSSTAAATNGVPRTTETSPPYLPNPFAPVAQPRYLSTVSKEEEEVSEATEPSSPQDVTNPKTVISSPAELSLAFQTMIRTRRTARQFRHTKEDDDPSAFYEYEMALLRAVQLAYSASANADAPPFFFQRILSPAAKDQLAVIAANVYFAQELLEFQRLGQADALQQLQATAARKREQWRQIPAYIVTLLSSSASDATKEAPLPSKEAEHKEVAPPQFDTLFDQDNVTYSDLQIYQPSPWAPLRTPRALDDYAAACAATQNAVLSLHAEQYATKWITGPILQTRALAQLLRLDAKQPTRVVALLQVGREDEETTTGEGGPAETTAASGMEYFRQLHQRQQEEQRGRRKKWNELLEDL